MTIADATSLGELPSLAGLFSSVRDAHDGSEGDAEALAAQIDQICAKARADFQRAAKGLWDSVSSLRSRPASSDNADLKSILEAFERSESENRRLIEENEEMLRSIENELRESPRYAADFQPKLTQLRDLGVDYLELYRDVKWELMALRSSLDDDREGPTFDNPKDLRRYLNSLPD